MSAHKMIRSHAIPVVGSCVKCCEGKGRGLDPAGNRFRGPGLRVADALMCSRIVRLCLSGNGS